jgi:hypothetical protein
VAEVDSKSMPSSSAGLWEVEETLIATPAPAKKAKKTTAKQKEVL